MNLKILEMMHFRPSGHNQVSLDHIECISEFFEEFCPIDKNKAKKMLRGSMGISMRYIQEYLDSFEAWKIIKIKAGTIEYLVKDVPQIIVTPSIEEQYDNIKSCVLPKCKYMSHAINGNCNPSPGINVVISPEACNNCKRREE